jgi:hypothetical protein
LENQQVTNIGLIILKYLVKRLQKCGINKRNLFGEITLISKQDYGFE